MNCQVLHTLSIVTKGTETKQCDLNNMSKCWSRFSSVTLVAFVKIRCISIQIGSPIMGRKHSCSANRRVTLPA